MQVARTRNKLKWSKHTPVSSEQELKPDPPQFLQMFPEIAKARNLISEVFGDGCEFLPAEALTVSASAAYGIPLSDSVDKGAEAMVRAIEIAVHNCPKTATERANIAMSTEEKKKDSTSAGMCFGPIRFDVTGVTPSANCIYVKGRDPKGAYYQLVAPKDAEGKVVAGRSYTVSGNIAFNASNNAATLWLKRAILITEVKDHE